MPARLPRTRLEHLQQIATGLERRMRACESDQNYALMSRERRAVLAEIDELAGDQSQHVTGLSEFERRLREREAAAKAPRRAEGV